MKIGDKVRVIHGSEEGFIVKVGPENLVEIETNDGFVIPVMASELVLIAASEKEFFEESEEKSIPSKKEQIAAIATGNKGVYLAFSRHSDLLYDVHLINNTGFDVLAAIHKKVADGLQTLNSGTVRSKATLLIAKWNIQDLSTWPLLEVGLLFTSTKPFSLPAIVSLEVKVKAKTFKNKAEDLPVLNKKGHLLQIDTKPNENTEINNITLATPNAKPQNSIARPEETIDIHIEKLSDAHASLTPHAILDIQMKAFEQHLDAIIVHQIPETTVIHGIGNGTLKNRIHKILSKRKDILYFEDAQKTKFGYGATRITIK